jgi:uncharacterized protein (TIGR02452 family)
MYMTPTSIFDFKLRNTLCWEDTQRKSSLLPPPPPSIKIEYDHDFYYGVMRRDKSNRFVCNMDTLDCAFLYENPLVLNMADDIIPGGWVNVGSFAQEESLFRRSNYHFTLTRDLYPILDTQAIYSPAVTVFKGPDLEPLDIPRQFAFIACPGIKYPFLDDDGKFEDEDYRILEEKIKTILQVAITYGHDSIIFGALGCGAWQNPSREVAQIFRNVLDDYDGYIPNFIFAILDDVDDMDDSDTESETEEKESNYEIFKDIVCG